MYDKIHYNKKKKKKHRKGSSTSLLLIVKGLQIKALMRCDFPRLRMGIMKKNANSKCTLEHGDVLHHPTLIWGFQIGMRHDGDQREGSFKTENRGTTKSCNVTPGPVHVKSHHLKRFIHPKLHCSTLD